MKNFIFVCLIVSIPFCIKCQKQPIKKEISNSELDFITKTFKEIKETDQLYRGPIAKETLDKTIIAKIDSVFDSQGIEAGLNFEASLNLEMPPEIKDSLWQLQHTLDFRNHMYLRGILEEYGWISEELVKDNNYIQILLLMHPPKDWVIPEYLENYSALLKQEVFAGRMPAKTYAMFYDNIKGKILREPQIYGTNQQFDSKTGKILPPGIKDLKESNKARKEIGLPLLKKGEYRIVSTKK